MIIKMDEMIKLIFSCKSKIKFLGIKSNGVHYLVDGKLFIAI